LKPFVDPDFDAQTRSKSLDFIDVSKVSGELLFDDSHVLDTNSREIKGETISYGTEACRTILRNNETLKFRQSFITLTGAQAND
jgi:hypothetical protein